MVRDVSEASMYELLQRMEFQFFFITTKPDEKVFYILSLVSYTPMSKEKITIL